MLKAEKIKELIEDKTGSIMKERGEKLEKEYLRNPFIRDAKVKTTKDGGQIRIDLNFDAFTDKQNIPLVFEYGGSIKSKEGKFIEILPGHYIERFLVKGE